jgi:hypothetical protein
LSQSERRRREQQGAREPHAHLLTRTLAMIVEQRGAIGGAPQCQSGAYLDLILTRGKSDARPQRLDLSSDHAGTHAIRTLPLLAPAAGVLWPNAHAPPADRAPARSRPPLLVKPGGGRPARRSGGRFRCAAASARAVSGSFFSSRPPACPAAPRPAAPISARFRGGTRPRARSSRWI